MKKIALVIFCIFVMWKWLSEPAPITYGPGAVAMEIPRQTKLTDKELYSIDGYSIEAVAKFEITARVLSKEGYRLGREADLSPVDLALGWGPMSDEKNLNQIRISQANRYFSWRVDDFPITRKEIETHSANMHLIPSDDSIKDAFKRVRQGHVVNIIGKLVNVRAEDGWRWRSSLTRNDTGKGACELVWVEQIEIVTL